jgi:hypothetical protein
MYIVCAGQASSRLVAQNELKQASLSQWKTTMPSWTSIMTLVKSMSSQVVFN